MFNKNKILGSDLKRIKKIPQLSETSFSTYTNNVDKKLCLKYLAKLLVI